MALLSLNNSTRGISTFQAILLAAFGLFTLVGVILFATVGRGTVGGGGGGESRVDLVMWGTLDETLMRTIISQNVVPNSDTIRVTYVRKSLATFNNDLLEALASGVGPDLFLLPHPYVFSNQDKAAVIPFETYNQRLFQDRFPDAADVFLGNDGIVAVPVFINPMVMYYNRDIVASSFRTNPPAFWDDMLLFTEDVTERDELSIEQSALAFGSMNNVEHGKDVLSMLIQQAGNSIMVPHSATGQLVSVLRGPSTTIADPAASAVRYFTSFADPENNNYTWNPALPRDIDLFIGGDLAVYFGYASEVDEIRRRNPNLNFDVAIVPQTRGSGVVSTFGQMYGIAISKVSPRAQYAVEAVALLSGVDAVSAIASATNTPPIRTELLSVEPTDAFESVFYNSAIIARAWSDPDPIQSEQIFIDLINSVNAGFETATQAVISADARLNALVDN